MRIALYSPYPVELLGVDYILETLPEAQLLWAANTTEDATAMLASDTPEVLVVRLKSSMEPFRKIAAANKKLTQPAILAVWVDSMYTWKVRGHLEMIFGGALGFIITKCFRESFFACLQSVIRKNLYYSDITEGLNLFRIGPRKAETKLTASEKKVLRLIPKGLSNEQIAAKLGISHFKVKVHLKNAKVKARVHCREIVLWVLSHPKTA